MIFFNFLAKMADSNKAYSLCLSMGTDFSDVTCIRVLICVVCCMLSLLLQLVGIVLSSVLAVSVKKHGRYSQFA